MSDKFLATPNPVLSQTLKRIIDPLTGISSIVLPRNDFYQTSEMTFISLDISVVELFLVPIQNSAPTDLHRLALKSGYDSLFAAPIVFDRVGLGYGSGEATILLPDASSIYSAYGVFDRTIQNGTPGGVTITVPRSTGSDASNPRIQISPDEIIRLGYVDGYGFRDTNSAQASVMWHGLGHWYIREDQYGSSYFSGHSEAAAFGARNDGVFQFEAQANRLGNYLSNDGDDSQFWEGADAAVKYQKSLVKNGSQNLPPPVFAITKNDDNTLEEVIEFLGDVPAAT